MDPPVVAAISFLAYFTLSWAIGERFPFSRYAMYADLGGRREGAVLYVRAEGRDVEYHRVVAWHGVAPAAIEPFTVPCSLQWVVFEAQRWIENHTTAQVEPGMQAVEVGYRILTVADDGSLSERRQVRATGLGRLAP